MIFINRPNAPTFLTDPNERWQKETEAAIQYYQNPHDKSFDFKQYNDLALKTELQKVFPKCAYCETSYGAVYDGDVEHFRPKGRVSEKNPATPGYYWLANEWTNLLLACQHCNQRRRHLLFGIDRYETQGKLDQFPLSQEVKRLIHPNSNFDEEEAVRLLINPCKDDPQDHFAYEEQEAVIRPLTPKGEVSIRVYVLQRRFLVQERKKQMLKLFNQMEVVEDVLVQKNADPLNVQLQKLFERVFEQLLQFTRDQENYAGMSRFFVKKFLIANGLIP